MFQREKEHVTEIGTQTVNSNSKIMKITKDVGTQLGISDGSYVKNEKISSSTKMKTTHRYLLREIIFYLRANYV